MIFSDRMISAGAFFGELALLSGDKQYTPHAVAESICEILRLKRDDFNTVWPRYFMHFNPRVM